ncbi:MAG: phosphoenolpyruvate--protein phosphotransferase [Bacteroidetes bacterium]|nr:phosphoenolpyruvate--protein phosphotransferase [Bacteroidota bacterium]
MDSASKQTEQRFKGIPASQGIAIGNAFVIRTEAFVFSNEHIEPERIPNEIARFHTALESSAAELQQIIAIAEKEASHVAPILETYLLILTDETASDSIRRRIQRGFYSAESAVMQEFDAQKQFFTLAKDPILRERAVELDHVRDRLLNGLRNRSVSHAEAENTIIVAPSITPTDLMLYNQVGALAFVTEVGGIASHASILARSLSMPAVIGVRNIAHTIHTDDLLIIDGNAGLIIINPKPDTLAKYQKRKLDTEENKRKLGKLVTEKSVTLDGHSVHLLANVDSIEDVTNAQDAGAEGIGLIRSEYLIIQRQHFPTEDEQLAWYNEIAERMYPNHVTLRAFDVGSDKYAEGLPHEDNPALGVRGIRFLLHRKDIFKLQIKAILCASKHRNVRLMLPMIATIDELIETKEFIEKCKSSLRKSNIPFDERMPLGMMIETPAAALMALNFAPHVDFFSIGTNDLTQYTLAADRTNEYVAGIFDPFHPAVLRLMKTAIDAAKASSIPVGICGEIAGHAAATELLIGLGVDELSVTPPLLLELKKRIRKTDFLKAQTLATMALRANSGSEVRKILANRKKK